MLAQQRHREILDRLGVAGGVRVTALAKALSVTEETTRRDLEKLGNERKLLRIHGGAVPVPDARRDLPFDVRKTENLEAKKAIATAALQHIDEGDVIALDASSTAFELARIIPDMPLTIVSSSVPVTVTLLPCSHVQVVSTGGILDRLSRSFTGSLAEQALRRLNINKLFLSSKGVDLERGLSEVTDDQARLKRRMIDAAERVYLLADHSKFGVRSVVFYAGTADADAVITDAGTDAKVIQALRETGLHPEIAA